MNNFIFLSFLFFTNLVFSQTNQDILNKLNDLEDERLFFQLYNRNRQNNLNDYPLNPQSNNYRIDNYDLNSQLPELYFLGSINQSKVYIFKSSIEKKGNLVYITTYSEHTKPKYTKLNRVYTSTGTNYTLDCQRMEIQEMGSVYFNGSKYVGLSENIENKKSNKTDIRTNKILSKINDYICPN